MRGFSRFIVMMLIIALAYYGLYLVKWEVRELKHENTLLEAQILQKERAIRVLETEWTYLNRPDRLKKLVEQHLPLQPAMGRQMAEFDHFQMPGPMPESEVKPAGYYPTGRADF